MDLYFCMKVSLKEGSPSKSETWEHPASSVSGSTSMFLDNHCASVISMLLPGNAKVISYLCTLFTVLPNVVVEWCRTHHGKRSRGWSHHNVTTKRDSVQCRHSSVTPALRATGPASGFFLRPDAEQLTPSPQSPYLFLTKYPVSLIWLTLYNQINASHITETSPRAPPNGTLRIL